MNDGITFKASIEETVGTVISLTSDLIDALLVTVYAIFKGARN